MSMVLLKAEKEANGTAKGSQLGQPISQMGHTDEKVCTRNVHLPYLGTNHVIVQKIKKDLIHKAKVKKSYAKLKEREFQQPQASSSNDQRTAESNAEPSLALHPERQEMLDKPEAELEEVRPPTQDRLRIPRERRRKPVPFEKEARLAEKRKAESEARRKEIEEANKQRQQKIEERERFRKAMAKARTGGKNGQRKLGRESKVLLEKVKRVIED